MSAASAQRGVTLIELLIVLSIIAVVSALLVPRLQESNARKLKRESERMALLLDLARSSAITGGKSIAFSMGDADYRFWRWNEGNWEMQSEGELRVRTLPEPLTLGVLSIDGVEQSAGQKLVFRPQGISPRFCIVLHSETLKKQVCGSRIGVVAASSVAGQP